MKKPQRTADSAHRAVGDEGGLVVLPKRSQVKVLNPVGSKIYSMLDGKHTHDEIVKAVTEEFDVNEDQARKDVSDFLEQLRSEEMLADDDAGSGA